MMRRPLRFAAGLLLLVLCAACGNSLAAQRDFTLQVTGRSGTPVTGEYIVTVGDRTTREKIDRRVPFTIDVSGHNVSAALQKHGADGTVRVQLLINGNAVAFDYTTDAYGSVRVATSLS